MEQTQLAMPDNTTPVQQWERKLEELCEFEAGNDMAALVGIAIGILLVALVIYHR